MPKLNCLFIIQRINDNLPLKYKPYTEVNKKFLLLIALINIYFTSHLVKVSMSGMSGSGLISGLGSGLISGSGSRLVSGFGSGLVSGLGLMISGLRFVVSGLGLILGVSGLSFVFYVSNIAVFVSGISNCN